MAISSKYIAIFLIFIFLSFPSKITCQSENNDTTRSKCGSDTGHGCRNKNEALKLKLVAIASILVTSMIGVCLPLVSRTVPSLQPDKNLFVLVKAFASGVILATGYMHVMPDSFDCLRSDCLPDNPWKKFSFTTFVAMLSAILTLSVDSYAMSYFKKYKLENGRDFVHNGKMESQIIDNNSHIHGEAKVDDKATQLLRYRVVAQVLELGIVVKLFIVFSWIVFVLVLVFKMMLCSYVMLQMFEVYVLGSDEV
ncbi:PREDICTED: zinc transporter 7-like [Nicotiana attenuata]|uniref:zinc transporter 7-like n=1 Tax=Nicotiana attenuata TaxID=49451 RepID=UPI0009054D28|nr:PREDICTED: zinc transporter 7-like [Nicotiana attenuata]